MKNVNDKRKILQFKHLLRYREKKNKIVNFLIKTIVFV